MLKKYSDALECSLCSGQLELDIDSTVDEYVIYMGATHSNLNHTVEELMNDFLVYTCVECGATHKYTSKEVERLLRRQLTKRALLLLIKDMIDPSHIIFEKYLIYCGKCQGFDGKGSCPKSIFEKCEIKRFPLNECL